MLQIRMHYYVIRTATNILYIHKTFEPARLMLIQLAEGVMQWIDMDLVRYSTDEFGKVQSEVVVCKYIQNSECIEVLETSGADNVTH